MNQSFAQSFENASTLANESIGLRMEIRDGQQLQIISRDLVPQIEGSMSLSLFNLNEETLAYLIALTEEADNNGFTGLLLGALGDHGYRLHGNMIEKHGLHYYLTCLNAKTDAEKSALVQRIQEAYDTAEFSVPVTPVIDTVDFKAITLDGCLCSNEVFATKNYTIVNIWSTVCQSCLLMLPELAAWARELPDNTQILHLTAEKKGIEHLDRTLLDQELERFGVDRDHVLLYDNGFSKVIDTILSATPLTFIVDSQGKLLGDVLLSNDIDCCKQAFDKLQCS